MARTAYVREIILASEEPKLCPNCQKEDRLEREVIYERSSDGRTILCTRCEALIVITNQNLKHVDLIGAKDCAVMLKEPHLIRRVTY